jgi:hypothetical protein
MTKTLFVRVVPHNGGLVFAIAQRAQLVAKINQAIQSSETWAESRKAMPPKEYSRVVRQAFDDNGERRPAGKDAFDPEALPGWSDGDYPPWLQPEMDQVLPIALLKQFGSREDTAVSGSYWHIPESNQIAICAALAACGWSIVIASELQFS